MRTTYQGIAVLSVLVVLGIAPLAQSADAVILEVSAGDAARRDVVVETALPEALRDVGPFNFRRVDTGDSVPMQVDRSGTEPRIVWIVSGELKAGATRRYRLTPTADKLSRSRIKVTDDKKRLLFQVGDKPVLAYNHATVPSPDPKHPYYARSGYIHPVYNPSGQVITDDFNPDHAHQHGIMLAWRQMTFENRSTNGWDQKAKVGEVKHSKLEAFGGGSVFGFLKSRLDHVDLTAPDGAKTALHETWRVRLYPFEDFFLFDITSTQTCATDSPVSIDKYHYGGLMIRGHADWHHDHSYDFLTDQGKSKANGNQSRPRWVDLFGPIEGQVSGALLMDHPDNFRFPQPVRLHPTMPYFCFTPASLGSFSIEPGQPYISRYRFCVHDGPLDQALADRLWRDFTDPPQVRTLIE